MTHKGDEETEHSELMKRNTMGMRETIMYRKETTTERVKFAKYFMLPPPMHFPTQKPTMSISRENAYSGDRIPLRIGRSPDNDGRWEKRAYCTRLPVT